jgi:hypothetical protein
MKFLSIPSFFIFLCTACFGKNCFAIQQQQPANDSTHFANEDHFANVRQLTFGGDNAEAYVSREVPRFSACQSQTWNSL